MLGGEGEGWGVFFFLPTTFFLPTPTMHDFHSRPTTVRHTCTSGYCSNTNSFIAMSLLCSRGWYSFPLQLERPEQFLALHSPGENISSNRFFAKLPLLVLTQTALCLTVGGILYEEPQCFTVVLAARSWLFAINIAPVIVTAVA